MGVLGGVFVLKSGLRILIWAPQVPFLVPKTPKTGHFGCFWLFWGYKNQIQPNPEEVGTRRLRMKFLKDAIGLDVPMNHRRKRRLSLLIGVIKQVYINDNLTEFECI